MNIELIKDFGSNKKGTVLDNLSAGTTANLIRRKLAKPYKAASKSKAKSKK